MVINIRSLLEFTRLLSVLIRSALRSSISSILIVELIVIVVVHVELLLRNSVEVVTLVRRIHLLSMLLLLTLERLSEEGERLVSGNERRHHGRERL